MQYEYLLGVHEALGDPVNGYLVYEKLQVLQPENNHDALKHCKEVEKYDHLIRRMPDLELDAESEIDKLLDVIIFKIQHYENLYMHCEFFKIIHDNYNSLFLKFLKKIEKIYLYFDNQRRHFDYDLEVLKIILTYNPKFITDL